MVDNAFVESSPYADSVLDPLIGELKRQQESTRAEVISLMAKLSNLVESCDKVR